jgi:hypothetical protein
MYSERGGKISGIMVLNPTFGHTSEFHRDLYAKYFYKMGGYLFVIMFWDFGTTYPIRHKISVGQYYLGPDENGESILFKTVYPEVEEYENEIYWDYWTIYRERVSEEDYQECMMNPESFVLLTVL